MALSRGLPHALRAWRRLAPAVSLGLEGQSRAGVSSAATLCDVAASSGRRCLHVAATPGASFSEKTRSTFSSRASSRTLTAAALASSAAAYALWGHWQGGEEAAHCEHRGSAQRGGTEGTEAQTPNPESSPELAKLESRGLTLPEGFVSELLAAVGGDAERVVVDEEECLLHAKPWNSYHPVINVPQAVVYPLSGDEVVSVVRCCGKAGVPIVAYGGGTALEGHATTPFGGVSLNMKLMNKVKAVHAEDMDVVVEPGADWISLNEYLLPYGLFFPLDPGPGATIGGMCATRCSGSLAVRYGTMRDNVIALKVVMPNGEVVKTASRARKSAAGYDLTRLMIGSEGTLGVITEVTLRVQHIPRFSAVAMCSFPTVRDAAKAATDTMHSGVQVSRVELLDEVMMHAINHANGYTYKEQPTLMYELVGNTEEHVHEQVVTVEGVVGKNKGSDFVFAKTEAAKKDLWRARKEALWAGYTLRPGTEPLITDVCVPLSRLADCIAETKEDLEKSSLPCPLLAHAGDGNMHVCIFMDTSKEEEVAEAKELAARMTMRALQMDGTCTGEHGVGVGKTQYLEKELGPEAVRTMRCVKDALDPSGIMNPGKVLPSRTLCP